MFNYSPFFHHVLGKCLHELQYSEELYNLVEYPCFFYQSCAMFFALSLCASRLATLLIKHYLFLSCLVEKTFSTKQIEDIYFFQATLHKIINEVYITSLLIWIITSPSQRNFFLRNNKNFFHFRMGYFTPQNTRGTGTLRAKWTQRKFSTFSLTLLDML